MMKFLLLLVSSWFLAALATAQQVASLTVVSSTITGGSLAKCVVALSAPAPNGGKQVNLSSSHPSVSVPSSVTVPSGQSKATFFATTTAVGSETLSTVVATDPSNGPSANTILTTRPLVLAQQYVVAQSSGQMVRLDLATLTEKAIFNTPFNYCDAYVRQTGQSPFFLYPRSDTLITYTTPDNQIWLTDINGSFQRQLTYVGFNSSSKFSPDGSRLIFLHAPTPSSSSRIVQQYDLATDLITNLMGNSAEEANGCDWMPNGNGYVYVTPTAIPGRNVVKWVSASGVTTTIGDMLLGGPQLRVSPNGTQLGFLGNDFGWSVETMSFATGALSGGTNYYFAGWDYASDGSMFFSSGNPDFGTLGVYRFLPWTGNSSSVAPRPLDNITVVPKIQYPIFAAVSTNGNYEIVRLSQDGSTYTNLTQNSSADLTVKASRDGRYLAFTSNRQNGGLMIMDVDGSNVRQVSPVGGEPDWSPDGTHLAIIHNGDIYKINIDGTNLVQVTSTTRIEGYPVWSPDGTKLAYTGSNDIYVANADGTNEFRLTSLPGEEWALNWSPDGSEIAFHNNSSGAWHIWVCPSAGGTPRQLTTSFAPNQAPSWTPYGDILYTRSGGTIWQMDRLGGSQIQVSTMGIVQTPVMGPLPSNGPPQAVPDSYATDEDTSLTGSSVLNNDIDPDAGAILTASLETGPQHAAEFSLNSDGSFHYLPAPNFHGQDTFTYRAQDNWGALSGAAVVTIQVTSVNDAPILNPIGDRTVNEQTLLTFTASAADPDLPTNTLVYTLENAPPGASVGIFSGVFQWTPTEAQGPGDYTFTVRVTDNGNPNLSDEETISVHVDEANIAPTLQGIGNKTADEGSGLTFTAIATDPDLPAQSLTFSLVGAPTGVAIHPTSGVFNWTPTEAQGPGAFTFKVRVTDSGSPSLFDEEEITVTVNEVNEPPVLNAIGNQTVDEMTLMSVTATASDPDLPGQALTFSLGTAPSGASINPTTGVITWTPSEADGPNPFTFEVIVSDGTATDTESFVVTVAEVNRPPVLTHPGDQTLAETATLSVQLAATDPDLPANGLTFEKVSGPASLTVSASGLVQWSPTESDGPATVPVMVRVLDNGNPILTDTRTFQVTVTEANLPPAIVAIPNQTIDEEAAFSYQIVASDPDLPGQTLTYYVAPGAPAGLTVDPQSGVLSWTPTESQGVGTYSVTVGVQDGLGGVDEKSFQITVREVVKTISGRIELQDYLGDITGQPITIELRIPGQPVALFVRTVNLTATGSFQFTTTSNAVPAGVYDIAVKGSHWLKRLMPSVAIAANGRSGIDFVGALSLINGDADGDNEVAIGDFAVISAAYGSTVGDPNWLASADLDGDLEVSIGDYAILSANYGLAGD
ncbi:MAG: tandem-95 repeat protein [Fimbriimonadaceae bacterium]|nr:tandem-95 repeat protein [Fimbriimonadaceae bacterium]